MRRALYLLLLLALPLAAQAPTLVRSVPTPIGYWSLASRGTNPETGKPMQIVTIARFKPDSTFDAVLKTMTDGEEGIGSGAVFHGRWEVDLVFGSPMVCTKRADAENGVCHYSLRADGSLWFVDRPLTPHTPEAVKAIAPELVD